MVRLASVEDRSMAHDRPKCLRCGVVMFCVQGYGRERAKQTYECLGCGEVVRGWRRMGMAERRAEPWPRIELQGSP